MPDVSSRVVHEPVGVCALITPWNYPLLQAAWKVAPALAAGNTFVLKPAELTPHTAILLMDVLDTLGLPAGVANLVLGAGAEAGAPLSTHPDVDLVSFTGGLVTGRKIAESAAATVKKVALELGGKNPNVIFADADFDAAVDNALNGAFVHSGQVCSAGARIVVEESIAQRFTDELGDWRVVLHTPFGKGINAAWALATATFSAAASTPVTSPPIRASGSVRRPAPHPTSSARLPASGWAPSMSPAQ